MIGASDFLDPAVAHGFDFWTGVPCSFLTPFIDAVGAADSLRYVGAVNEGDAVAIAAGAHLVGRRPVVLFQNSGLGNAVNPLTSLCEPFAIAPLLIVTHRGAPGLPDEPQHAQMGAITCSMLDALQIRWERFPQRRADVRSCLERATAHLDSSKRPFALVMSKGSVADSGEAPKTSARNPSTVTSDGGFGRDIAARMSRADAVRAIRNAVAGELPLIASTGKLGRELFALGHAANQFYMVGSMGCAAAIGLGICAGRAGQGAVVIDGDGALLMRMGTLATVGYEAPEGFCHVVLDNEVHESTGAQPTVSAGVDFAAVAAACGYAHAQRVDTPEALVDAIERALVAPGPHFVHAKVAVGSAPNLPRPDRSPEALKDELVAWLDSQ